MQTDVKLEILPILDDNYTYIMHDGDRAAIIDPGEVSPILSFLDAHNLRLELIINTHHHGDHTAGNAALKKRYNCPIAAPNPSADIVLNEANPLQWNGLCFDIIATPGHTLDHVILAEPTQYWLFSGDTLFRLGCGRVFEGTYEQMFHSLQKVKQLDDQYNVYCGHEYSKGNAAFALSYDESDLMKTEHQSIQDNAVTIPFSLGKDKKLNPFLTCETCHTFQERREAKDQF